MDHLNSKCKKTTDFMSNLKILGILSFIAFGLVTTYAAYSILHGSSLDYELPVIVLAVFLFIGGVLLISKRNSSSTENEQK